MWGDVNLGVVSDVRPCVGLATFSPGVRLVGTRIARTLATHVGILTPGQPVPSSV